jgi:hypothetical protein
VTGARRAAVGLVVGALSASLTGCAGLIGGHEFSIGLDNDTDRPVELFIDGRSVGSVGVGSTQNRGGVHAPGDGPWRIEARTATGVVLVAAEVAEVPPAGQGVGAAAATTCGDITIWAGDTRPDVVVPDVTGGRVACDG